MDKELQSSVSSESEVSEERNIYISHFAGVSFSRVLRSDFISVGVQ